MITRALPERGPVRLFCPTYNLTKLLLTCSIRKTTHRTGFLKLVAADARSPPRIAYTTGG